MSTLNLNKYNGCELHLREMEICILVSKCSPKSLFPLPSFQVFKKQTKCQSGPDYGRPFIRSGLSACVAVYASRDRSRELSGGGCWLPQDPQRNNGEVLRKVVLNKSNFLEENELCCSKPQTKPSENVCKNPQELSGSEDCRSDLGQEIGDNKRFQFLFMF